jgi:8-oxo-dGTP diphosphatase
VTDRFVVVPAAYVFLLRPASVPGGREVLLQLRSGTDYMDGHWAAAAAGHVERGESVYDAAAREAAEEIDVGDLVLEPWCAMQRTGVGDDPLDERVDYFFTATSWSGTPRIVEPEKCADLRWFPLDALPDPLVPHELRVLESLRAGSTPPILVHGF